MNVREAPKTWPIGFLLACASFASVAKNLPPLNLPIDLTLVSIVFLLLGLLFFIRYETSISHVEYLPLLFFILFCGFYALSITWSRGSNFAVEKIADLVAICGLTFVGAYFVARRERTLLVFLWTFLGLAVSFGLQVLSATGGNPVNLLKFDIDYLSVGRLLSFAGTIALGLAVFGTGVLKTSSLLLLSFSLFLGTALLGGRAPLIGFVLSAIPLFFSPLQRDLHLGTRQMVQVKRFWLGAMVVALGAVALAFLDLSVVSRLVQLVTGAQDGTINSLDQRLEYYLVSFDVWWQSPWLGMGVGGWSLAAGIGDSRLYPHNLFLELLCEVGVAGLSLFLLVVASAYGNLNAAKSSPKTWLLATIILSLFFNVILSALVSSALPDQRLLFLSLGLMAGLKEPRSHESRTLFDAAPNALAQRSDAR